MAEELTRDEELTECQKATQRLLDRYTSPDGTVRFLPANSSGGRFTRALMRLEYQHRMAYDRMASVRFVG